METEELHICQASPEGVINPAACDECGPYLAQHYPEQHATFTAEIVASVLAEAERMGVVPGAHVVTHRWMFPEMEGDVDPVGVEVSFNGDLRGEGVFGFADNDADLFGLHQIVSVNGVAVEGGGEW